MAHGLNSFLVEETYLNNYRTKLQTNAATSKCGKADAPNEMVNYIQLNWKLDHDKAFIPTLHICFLKEK